MTDTKRRSNAAYQAVLHSGLVAQRAQQVYAIHYLFGPMGKREMYETFKARNPTSSVQVDSMSPRYRQLVDAGLLDEVGEHKCPYTGQTITVYDVTDKVPTQRLSSLTSLKKDYDTGINKRIDELENRLEETTKNLTGMINGLKQILDKPKQGDLF
tara:strand:- start:993 stop:1460 length:468 start_codon:yes stop_codon:yes gene_type:complete